MRNRTKNRLITATKYMLLAAYLSGVFYLTFLNREQEPVRQAWTELFGSYRRAWKEENEFILWGLIDNIIMMIPLGILLPWICSGIRLSLMILISVGISLLIECNQYVTRLGYFDVDDMFNNLWGALIGYGIFVFFREYGNLKKQKNMAVSFFKMFAALLPAAAFGTILGIWGWRFGMIG